MTKIAKQLSTLCRIASKNNVIKITHLVVWIVVASSGGVWALTSHVNGKLSKTKEIANGNSGKIAKLEGRVDEQDKRLDEQDKMIRQLIKIITSKQNSNIVIYLPKNVQN